MAGTVLDLERATLILAACAALPVIEREIDLLGHENPSKRGQSVYPITDANWTALRVQRVRFIEQICGVKVKEDNNG